MSRTFELSGTNVLRADYYPSIELNSNKRYGLGLLGFYGCNSIQNIKEHNNAIRFNFVHPDSKTPDIKDHIIVLVPPGAYEIEEINNSIRRELYWKLLEKKIESLSSADVFTLQPNTNTLKCEVFSPFEIDFTINNSIGSLLGFKKDKYLAGKTHESTELVDIAPVRLIRLECNIISGSYINGNEEHSLFTFDIDVEPGYRLTKEPHNIIYLPISPEGRRFIDNITIYIVSEKGDLIDFGNEISTIILELKELK